MRCKVAAGLAIVTLAAAMSCSDGGGDDDGAGGEGGEGSEDDAGGGGGSGGSSSKGGKGGSGIAPKGGSGGVAQGGSGGVEQGGSGGVAQGGSGGVAQGGSGGVAQGGSAGQAACIVDKAGFTQDFEMPSQLWEDNDTVTPASTAISGAQKHGGQKSMEISFQSAPASNADGGVDAGARADAGADAGANAAGLSPRPFYIINMKDGLAKMAKYIQKGRTISIWVFLPEGNKVESVELGANSEAGFHFTWTGKDRLAPGMWHKLTHTFASVKQKVNDVEVDVDYDCSKPKEKFQLGLAFNIAQGQSWNGKVYVDDFEIAPAP